MNYVGIEENSMLNGDGLRTILWVAGCEHNCKGCHNPSTHSFTAGSLFTDSVFKELLECLKQPYCSGLTLSGGDPLALHNREETFRIATRVKELLPNKSIWCYTGYSFEDVESLPIAKYVDVFVTGKFIESLASVQYEWAGSTNQKVMRKVNGVFTDCSCFCDKAEKRMCE